MEYVFKYVYSKNVITVRMNVWIEKRDFNSLTQVMNEKKKGKLINCSLTSFTHYYVQNFTIIIKESQNFNNSSFETICI